MMPMPPGGHPAWNLYFACEDVDATVARAGELGGGDGHGADGRAQRLALRDPARPAATRCSALRPGRWTTRRAILPVAPVDPGLARYAATATPMVGKKRWRADRVVDAVAAQPVAHRVLELGERELDAGGLELVVEARRASRRRSRRCR